jgi:hypothetical protein
MEPVTSVSYFINRLCCTPYQLLDLLVIRRTYQQAYCSRYGQEFVLVEAIVYKTALQSLDHTQHIQFPSLRN